MSKLLDSLTQKNKHSLNDKENSSANDPSNKNHQSVQQELVRTYFSSHPSKTISPEKTAADKTTSSSRLKIRIFIWLIISVILLAAGFILLAAQKINIQVTLVAGPAEKGKIAGNITPPDSAMLKINTEGHINTRLIRKTYFAGHDSEKSHWGKDYLVLVNTANAGWRAFCVDFAEPMNFSNFYLSFLARGQKGGERLRVVLKDANNRAYSLLDPYSLVLTNGWESVSIPLDKIKDTVDIQRIKQFRFEFGSVTAKNKPGATIYLKDITFNR